MFSLSLARGVGLLHLYYSHSAVSTASSDYTNTALLVYSKSQLNRFESLGGIEIRNQYREPMKPMTLGELKQIVEANGKLDGYDLSHIRTGRGPVLWNYVDVARQYLKPTDRVLDIGTGGGEIFFFAGALFRQRSLRRRYARYGQDSQAKPIYPSARSHLHPANVGRRSGI